MTDTKIGSFEDAPPTVTIDGKSVQLRPYSGLCHYQFLRGKDLYSAPGDTAACLAYIAIHSKPPLEAARMVMSDEKYREAIVALSLDVTIEDIVAVADYLGRVLKRHEEAQVEAADAPGKESAG